MSRSEHLQPYSPAMASGSSFETSRRSFLKRAATGLLVVAAALVGNPQAALAATVACCQLAYSDVRNHVPWYANCTDPNKYVWSCVYWVGRVKVCKCGECWASSYSTIECWYA